MTAHLCTSDYKQVFDLIQTHTGLRVHSTRFDEISHVVDDVIASMNYRGVNDLMLALVNTSFTERLWQILIQAITVGETYFFRDQGQMDALRTHILPQLIEQREKSGQRLLRLWSAGCASGEEPYTLVMMLHELLPDYEDWRIMVLGTDINLAFLERARRGVYRPSSFRNETPAGLQQRWFKQTAEGFRLDQSIRDRVTFVPLNLAHNSYPLFENFTMQMDLIVCRNVTIYFDESTVCDIISRFYRAISDNGILMVGHSELSTTMYHEFSTHMYHGMIYYQKDPDPEPAPMSAITAPPPVKRPATARLIPRTGIGLPPIKLKARLAARIQPPKEADLEAVWARAKNAADREKWEEALACLAEVEVTHKFQPEFHYLRGLVQMAAENTDHALRAWRQALYCDPSFALAHYSLGELYEQRGERKAAARHWRQAMAAIARLEPQHRLLFSEDVTVEMLQGLLQYRVCALQNDEGR